MLYGSALFLYTGPILTRFSAVRIDFRRAYIGASYFLLGLFMFWVVAKNIVLMLGVTRDWSKPGDGPSGTQFADIDA